MTDFRTSPETERSAFIAAYPHLSMDEVPDAWGRPMFKHSHVQALWDGWFARACLDDRKSDLAPRSDFASPVRDALMGLNDAIDLYWNEGRTDGQVKNICYWQFKAKEALAQGPDTSTVCTSGEGK